MERSLEDSIKNKTYIDNLRSAAKVQQGNRPCGSGY